MQQCGQGPANRTSKRTLRTQIRPSQIPGAGNGLWLMEEAKPGQVVARYSGEEITKEEVERRVQVTSPRSQKCLRIPSLFVLCVFVIAVVW